MITSPSHTGVQTMKFIISISDQVKVRTVSRLQFDVKNTFDNTPELQGHEFKIVTDELNFLNEVEVEIEGEKYGENIQTKATHWLSKEIAAVVADCEDLEFNEMDFGPSV
jgi:hypothetical protein